MHRRDLRGLISRPTVRKRTAIVHRSIRTSTICSPMPTKNCSMKSSRSSFSAFITNSNIRNCSSRTSNTSSRKTRSIRSFDLLKIERCAIRTSQRGVPTNFIEFDETIAEIGHDGDGFAYDNEGPRHRALVPAFSLASRPVTNGEYIEFIEDNGYRGRNSGCRSAG